MSTGHFFKMVAKWGKCKNGPYTCWYRIYQEVMRFWKLFGILVHHNVEHLVCFIEVATIWEVNRHMYRPRPRPRPAENSSRDCLSAISAKADCRSPAEISSFPEDEFWPSKGGAVFRLGRAGLAWIAAIWHHPVPAIGCSPSGEFYQTDPDLSSMPTVIIFFFPIKSESNSGWGLGDYLWS